MTKHLQLDSDRSDHVGWQAHTVRGHMFWSSETRLVCCSGCCCDGEIKKAILGSSRE